MAMTKTKKQRAWDIYLQFEADGKDRVLSQWESLWHCMEATNTHYDLLEPIEQEVGTRFQAMLLGLYAYAPSSRGFIIDMIGAVGAHTNVVNGILEAMTYQALFHDEFMVQADDLFEWAITHGGVIKDIPNTRYMPEEAAQWVYDKACKHKGGKEGVVSSSSFRDLCMLGGQLVADYGDTDKGAIISESESYWEVERIMFGWLKDQFGLKIAFSKALKGGNHDLANHRRAIYTFDDLAEVFTGGNLLNLLDLHRQASGDLIRNASKAAMVLVLQDSGYREILKEAERPLIAYWRKAGLVDDVAWLQLVETTDSLKEAVLAKDLGL